MKITPKIAKNGISSYEAGFEDFFKTLRPSLKPWDFFVNWSKVYENSKSMESDLNIWNQILGKENFDKEFRELVRKNPRIVMSIPSLIVRDGSGSMKFTIIEDKNDLTKPDSHFDFSKPANSDVEIDNALRFVKNSGLAELFTNRRISNLVDYMVGVEAGLDSNGRKNRSGTGMESVVEAYLHNFVKQRKLEFIRQAPAVKIKSKWGFSVPVDKSSRAFDFAISDGSQLVLMEVNFYGGGGSKLKATAGEYKGLFDLLTIPNTKFVWITDGDGWKTTKRPLEEAYKHIDYIWNLNWLSRGYLEDLFN
jgi:type II restriction enzyme